MAAETHSRIHIHTSQVFVTVSAAKGEAFNKICKLTCDCFMSEGRPWKNSHQTFLTPNTFYTRHLIQFTSGIFYKTPFTPANVYTTHRLHETSYYTSQHQPPFTPVTFNFAPGCTFQQRTWTQNYTQHKQFLHQTTSTPDALYTKHLYKTRFLHQTPVATDTSHPLHEICKVAVRTTNCYHILQNMIPYYEILYNITIDYKLHSTTK